MPLKDYNDELYYIRIYNTKDYVKIMDLLHEHKLKFRVYSRKVDSAFAKGMYIEEVKECAKGKHPMAIIVSLHKKDDSFVILHTSPSIHDFMEHLHLNKIKEVSSFNELFSILQKRSLPAELPDL